MSPIGTSRRLASNALRSEVGLKRTSA